MFIFKEWLDEWVSVQQYPDDPVTVEIGAGGNVPTPAAGWSRPAGNPGPAEAFRAFWGRYNARKELGDLPLATIRALLGAREARFTGHLVIRSDLPAAEYLEIPFVRRSWRLLRLLADSLDGIDRRDGGVLVAEPSLDGDSITMPWAVTRELEMEPASARVNIGVIVSLLLSSGLVDPNAPGGLSARALELVEEGSVGGFYKALCIRAFNRAQWTFEDDLPNLSAIQLNALFMVLLLHHAGETGCTALEIAGRLGALAQLLTLQQQPDLWLSDSRLIAAAIHSRFFSRVGRMLGLVERAWEAEEPPAEPICQRYRTTTFARRTLLWQM